MRFCSQTNERAGIVTMDEFALLILSQKEESEES